jgi:hypothetical protein
MSDTIKANRSFAWSTRHSKGCYRSLKEPFFTLGVEFQYIYHSLLTFCIKAVNLAENVKQWLLRDRPQVQTRVGLSIQDLFL